MGTLVSIIIDSLSFGGVYALLAMGFAVILRSSRVAQFGAGYVALLGGLLLSHLTGSLPEGVSLALTLPAGGLLGVALYLAIAKIGERTGVSETSLSIGALAIGLLIGSIIDDATAGATQTAPIFVRGYFTVGGSTVQWNEVVAIGLAAVVLVATYLLIDRSMLGKAMTAVCRAPEVARAYGLRVSVVVGASWAIATALMTFAGGILTPMSPLSTDTVLDLALKGFAGAIIGGVDRPAYAASGALILGLLDTLFVRYVSGGLEDLFVFGVVFVLLVLRPGGLFRAAQVRYA